MHRVLLVDDEEDILDALKTMLESKIPKATIRTTTRPQDALKMLASEDFALIVTDFRMPGMDGLEFAREARKISTTIPIILMTAYPDPTLAQSAKDAGIGLMIAKPFESKFVVQLVKGIIEGRGFGP